MTLNLSAAARSAAIAALCAAVAPGVVGCQSSGSKAGTGFLVGSYAALKPDHLALKECNLELAGTKYKAQIREERKGDDVQIDLTAYDQVIESEKYRSTSEEFSVVDAGGERYDPPIPLVKYGMRVGSEWSWAGSLWYGPEPHKTSATVRTSTEDLVINGGSAHCIKIEVVRTVESGKPGSVSSRTLKFWIAPNMGVVKRSFGDDSIRAPLEP